MSRAAPSPDDTADTRPERGIPERGEGRRRHQAGRRQQVAQAVAGRAQRGRHAAGVRPGNAHRRLRAAAPTLCRAWGAGARGEGRTAAAVHRLPTECCGALRAAARAAGRLLGVMGSAAVGLGRMRSGLCGAASGAGSGAGARRRRRSRVWQLRGEGGWRRARRLSAARALGAAAAGGRRARQLEAGRDAGGRQDGAQAAAVRDGLLGARRDVHLGAQGG